MTDLSFFVSWKTMSPLYFKVSIVQPYQAMAERKPGMLIWELKTNSIVLKTLPLRPQAYQ